MYTIAHSFRGAYMYRLMVDIDDSYCCRDSFSCIAETIYCSARSALAWGSGLRTLNPVDLKLTHIYQVQ